MYNIIHSGRDKPNYKKQLIFFFFNDTATPEIYTLSLHDALPIWLGGDHAPSRQIARSPRRNNSMIQVQGSRSEEHTSELQSQSNLVCRLLLEKKKTKEQACGNYQVQLSFHHHNHVIDAHTVNNVT